MVVDGVLSVDVARRRFVIVVLVEGGRKYTLDSSGAVDVKTANFTASILLAGDIGSHIDLGYGVG